VSLTVDAGRITAIDIIRDPGQTNRRPGPGRRPAVARVITPPPPATTHQGVPTTTHKLPGSGAARHGSGDADLTLMIAAHQAFSRDLISLARAAGSADLANAALPRTLDGLAVSRGDGPATRARAGRRLVNRMPARSRRSACPPRR
jgi:hypothetical protein